jgi:hypothetical protein
VYKRDYEGDGFRLEELQAEVNREQPKDQRAESKGLEEQRAEENLQRFEEKRDGFRFE